MQEEVFKNLLLKVMNNKDNPFHPFVFINGEPIIGENVTIGFFSEINAKDSRISIGDHCDIASFVAINAADSHKRCIGISKDIERKSIIIEHHVFIGSHSFIKGGAYIGHHTVVAAGTMVEGIDIPPYSLVIGNPADVKKGYYRNQIKKDDND
jgi:acetyltransferase-like isoleucine patch superfamily enzyme